MAGLQQRAIEAFDEELGPLEYVDLAIDLFEWDGRRKLASIGGRWDVELGEWSEEPVERRVRWRVQPAQYEAARFFVEWMSARARGERVPGWEDIYTLMAIGGRGGGKSDFGVRAGLLMAITFPGTIAWFVSPVIRETQELQRVIEELIPEAWYHFADGTFHFWNGSTVTLMSGYDPGTLKQGRVDYFLLNEAQRFPLEAYKMVAPRIADRSGIGYLACNPPREAKGRWVMEFYDRLTAQAAAGHAANDNDIRDIRLLRFEARKNPAIDWHRLELLRATFGDLDYRREIEGEMLPIGDLVFYGWNSAINVRPAPDLGNITARMTKRRLGRPFAHVIGMDFNKQPWMSARAWEFYADPDDPKGALAWLVRAWSVKGSEDDLLDAIEAAEYDGEQIWTPENTGLVIDASAWFQNPERTKGKKSQEILAARGWKCFRPAKRMKKNPLVVERVVLANALFRSSDGRSRAFCSPECTEGAEEIKNWPNTKWGSPDTKSDYSHGCDASTYVLYRFFPRLERQQRFTYQTGAIPATDRQRELEGL